MDAIAAPSIAKHLDQERTLALTLVSMQYESSDIVSCFRGNRGQEKNNFVVVVLVYSHFYLFCII